MSSNERVKRLTPKPETIRRLFLLSGNQCAYPGCSHPIILDDGTYVGEICHIRAAEKGGERFDINQTNESRRHFDNLMLMCMDHHVLTNDVAQFTPERMRQMKAEHEQRFKIGLATMMDSTAGVHIEGSSISLGGEGGRAPGAGGGGGGAIGKGAIAGRGGEGGRTFWQDKDGARIESSDPLFPKEAKEFIDAVQGLTDQVPGAGGGGGGAAGDGARGGDGGHGGDSVTGTVYLEPGTYRVNVGEGGRAGTLPGEHSYPGGDTQLLDEQGRVVTLVSGGRRVRHASSYLPDGVREVTHQDVLGGLKMPLLAPSNGIEFQEGLINMQGGGWDHVELSSASDECVWKIVCVIQGQRPAENIGLYIGLFNPAGEEMACSAIVLPPTPRTVLFTTLIGAKLTSPGLWKIVAYSGQYVLAEFSVEVRKPQ